MASSSSSYLLLLLLLLINILECLLLARSVPYDSSFNPVCLATPPKPLYNGGMVVNPEFNQGLKGWRQFGEAKVEHRISYSEEDGLNSYIIASERKLPYHSFSQKFHLQKGKIYTFSAWVRTSHEKAPVAAVFKTKRAGYIKAGWGLAVSGCWSMMKGGLHVNASGSAHLYFESENTDVEIWADSISLQSFTREEWKSHQQQNVERSRKKIVKFEVLDNEGFPVENATVSISQLYNNIPVGCAINQNILGNQAYQDWFTSRFSYTVFENELKWYSIEQSQGAENYATADSLLQFAQNHGISVRGHNILWDDPKYQPSWVSGLYGEALQEAANRRVESVMSRYQGKLIHWDVMNENLHFHFYEDKLGPSASTNFYQRARQLDGKVTLFMNDFNTIEEPGDYASSPANYAQKIQDELHSNPAVQGIMFWSAYNPQGCYQMCLTDGNFNNLQTGNVVDQFLNQLKHAYDSMSGTTDSNGFFQKSLYHGKYEVRISHPDRPGQDDVHHIHVLPQQHHHHHRQNFDDDHRPYQLHTVTLAPTTANNHN
ncbi:Glycosyl hydrolase family 10 protein [Striga hermonthica]|uniref:Glycosyl hydrolase family 10 protein n=1 Tax=Striga hermonthica TaxID=68872 RepID=A0A9N7RI55_STRHE|nr:Glycosyl hydrolase family 10 protein [Striga hermonthica]